MTVIDATNVQKDARASILYLAKEQNCFAVAIVLDIPEKVCREQNEKRSNRNFGRHVITHQAEQLRKSIRQFRKEGFRYVYDLSNEEEATNTEIVRTPLWSNKKTKQGLLMLSAISTAAMTNYANC